MAAIGLTVEAAGRHPGVEILGAIGHGLQQVQHVQSDHPHGVGIVVEVDVEALPQMRPLAHMALAQIGVAVELVQ